MAIENEEQAFEAIMGAVTGPDSQELDEAQRIDDEPEQIEDAAEDGQGAAEPPEDGQEKAGGENDDADEEDFVEVEFAEGQKERLPVKELVQVYKQFSDVQQHAHELYNRVRDEAVAQAQHELGSVRQQSEQVGAWIAGALQLLQAPQPPDTALLEPTSREYNPDKYHRDFAQYQRAMQQHGIARQIGQQLLGQAKAAEAQAQDMLEQRELERLQRQWPEFGRDREITTKFVQDMRSTYGFTPEELDNVLTDHRQALVARDALAYRAMRAESGKIKERVEAKAPKLVRGKTEAKVQLRQQDAKGRFVSDAKSRLAKDQSDEAAAAYFASLIKAGRI